MGANDNNMYAMNGTTGEILWSFTAQDVINSSPAIGVSVEGGSLVFGSNGMRLACMVQTVRDEYSLSAALIDCCADGNVYCLRASS